MRLGRLSILVGVMVPCAGWGQWSLLESGTTAGLRGIHNAGGGVAWASGTEGTVLRTLDGGKTWQKCSVPPDGEKLDFRGIRGFDARRAIVMSSGKGALSRVYKTVDGCRTWQLVFTNPDEDGFFDAISADSRGGVVVGDPVGGRFAVFVAGKTLSDWKRAPEVFAAQPGDGLFAASNSSIDAIGPRLRAFVSGGPSGASLVSTGRTPLPLVSSESAGPFSLARRPGSDGDWMIVGGDYRKPDETQGNAVFVHGGVAIAPGTPPGGYRSSVVWDAALKAWIAVGPNGTDVTNDDGKNWRAVRPGKDDAPDADRNWNAISLPYVVGPSGRIGKWNFK